GDATPEHTADASPGHNASCPQDRLRLSHGCSSSCAKSGRRVRLDNPCNNLYEIRPKSTCTARLSGAVDAMRIQEVGLDTHIRECGSQPHAGLYMLCRMKRELRLFVTLEPCFAAVCPTIPMCHHQDAFGVMEMARRGNLSKQEGAVACLLW